MTDLKKIVEDLSSLSVVEASELSKMLEEKWGVSAAAPVAVAAAPTSEEESTAEEKSEFDVELTPEDSMDMLSVKLIRMILSDTLNND